MLENKVNDMSDVYLYKDLNYGMKIIISLSSLFQSFGADTEKARDP